MGADPTIEQHLTDSKERALEDGDDGVRRVCGTDDGGHVVLIDNERLSIYDKRGRRIATISDLGAMFDAFDGLEI